MPDEASFSKDVTELEAELGLGIYLTTTPGIGGRLRTVPEDFRVIEEAAAAAEAQGKGKYTLATIQARNWETHRLVRELSKRLGVSERSIYFTGTKDKRAVTVQNMALPVPEDRVKALDMTGIELLETKRVDRAPKLGEHAGNAFQIRIRELTVDLDEALARSQAIAGTILEHGGFPNYFGPQRFGSVRPITHTVGEHLVHGRYDEAVWTYIAQPHPMDPQGLNEAREQVWEQRDPKRARELLPGRLDFEHTLLDALLDGQDALGALERLPRTLNRLFVSAYQSHLFNRMLTRRVDQAHPQEAHIGDLLHPADEAGAPDPRTHVPVTQANAARCREATAKGQGFPTAALPGYEADLAGGLQGEIERQVMEEAGVAHEDFRILEAPHLSSSGTRRAMWCPVDKLEVDGGEDEHGPFIQLAFYLPKGSYATCLLREVMKAPITAY